ncbi:MAG: hypothetical protein QM652_00580 [Legionella sp.]|uniref:hypothetical protein n=1 Tax=Legionella sp. TaxID=459 RepID=UPI0039E2CA4E
MKKQLLPLIPDNFKTTCQMQTTELGRGGADLVKLDRAPLVMASEDFTELTQFKQTVVLPDGTQHEVSFPLLENPDGIVYYTDSNKMVNFYYIKYATKEIVPIEPIFTSEEDKTLFEAFKHSFDAMENNSSRRSSNVEHQLITRLFQYTLHRQGILYEQNGIQYCDNRTAFSLINAYRTSIRLYNEAEQNNLWKTAHSHWREGVGNAQRKIVWLLQRLCERNRSFYPILAQFDDFNREVKSGLETKEVAAVVEGKIIAGLGSTFALYKSEGITMARRCRWPGYSHLLVDLVVVWRLIDDAKANIMKQSHESKLDFQASVL